MNRGLASLFCIAVLLGGCGGVKELNIKTTPTVPAIEQPAHPREMKLLPLTFVVINKDNVDAFLADVKKNNGVIIGVTTKTYENMALNVQEMRRYIQQQKQIIVYYESVTAPTPPKEPPPKK